MHFANLNEKIVFLILFVMWLFFITARNTEKEREREWLGGVGGYGEGERKSRVYFYR